MDIKSPGDRMKLFRTASRLPLRLLFASFFALWAGLDPAERRTMSNWLTFSNPLAARLFINF